MNNVLGLCDLDCGRGHCYEDQCYCDVGWFGAKCDQEGNIPISPRWKASLNQKAFDVSVNHTLQCNGRLIKI